MKKLLKRVLNKEKRKANDFKPRWSDYKENEAGLIWKRYKGRSRGVAEKGKCLQNTKQGGRTEMKTSRRILFGVLKQKVNTFRLRWSARNGERWKGELWRLEKDKHFQVEATRMEDGCDGISVRRKCLGDGKEG